MAGTARPIATISYNSTEHIERVCDSLYRAHKIKDYRYIWHKGEDGDKDHIHLWVWLNKQLDEMQLAKAFEEVVQGEDMPRGVMPWRKSDIENWLLYVLHYKPYLFTHNKLEEAMSKIEYNLEDIVSPFPQQVQRDFRTAKRLVVEKPSQEAFRRLAEGESTARLIAEGFAPSTLASIISAITREQQYKAHIPIINHDTGVIEDECTHAPGIATDDAKSGRNE